MRIAARLVIGLLTVAVTVAFAPIAALALLVLGISELSEWAELHGQFDGDKAAQDRAHWRNS